VKLCRFISRILLLLLRNVSACVHNFCVRIQRVNLNFSFMKSAKFIQRNAMQHSRFPLNIISKSPSDDKEKRKEKRKSSSNDISQCSLGRFVSRISTILKENPQKENDKWRREGREEREAERICRPRLTKFRALMQSRATAFEGPRSRLESPYSILMALSRTRQLHTPT